MRQGVVLVRCPLFSHSPSYPCAMPPSQSVSRSLGVLSALLAAGASVTAANRLGLTPLTLALCCRDYTPAADAGTRAGILGHYRQACVMLLEAGAAVPASLKAAKLGPFESGASADLFAFCKG